MGAALAGSDRPLIVTSFTGLGNTVPGEPGREDNDPDPGDINRASLPNSAPPPRKRWAQTCR